MRMRCVNGAAPGGYEAEWDMYGARMRRITMRKWGVNDARMGKMEWDCGERGSRTRHG
jgi:hypothetical protein